MLLGNTFDLDRDITLVKNDVANLLSQVFAPNEYNLEECVMEGTFQKGRVLLRLTF